RSGASPYSIKWTDQAVHISSLTVPTFLDANLPAFNLDNVSVGEALAALHHAVNPRVPDRFEGGAYTGGDPARTDAIEAIHDITTHLKDVTVRDAFDAVAAQTGGGIWAVQYHTSAGEYEQSEITLTRDTLAIMSPARRRE